jgi:hypothetical protein
VFFISLYFCGLILQTSARMGSNVDVAFDLVCSAAVANKLRDEAVFHSNTTPSSQVPRSPVDQLGQSSAFGAASSAAASSPSRNVARNESAPSTPVVNLAASQLGEASAGEQKSCAC